MFGAADPDFLPVDDVAIALAPGEGADARGVGAAGRFGDAESLQTQLARGDLRQILRLLLGASVPQHGAHRVHLRVTGRAVAAGAMDFLEDRGRGAEPQSRAAEFLRDQHGEVAFPRQAIDERLGIRAFAIERAPIFSGEVAAEPRHGVADFGMVRRLVGWKRHGLRTPPISRGEIPARLRNPARRNCQQSAL